MSKHRKDEFDDLAAVLQQGLSRKNFLAGLGLGAVALAAAGCGSSPSSSKSNGHSKKTGTVNVGDKGFTEEYLVADMYQLLLEHHGFTVKRHSVGTAALAQQAILKGDFDLFPEYTGTGYLDVLGHTTSLQNPTKLYDAVKTAYQKKYKLTWLAASPMNDTNSVALKKQSAAKYNIKTMSDLAGVANKLTFVGLAECVGRIDCLKGMESVYGIHFKNVITTGSAAVNYSDLLNGHADVTQVFTTDGQITADHLVVPIDDKHVFPPDNVAPVVRDATLSQFPSIRPILNGLAPKITTTAIRSLNADVDIHGKDHLTVARGFLKAQGML
ncbi:MAG: glycine betaine ABC transporter substrate-binding protein [Chloroflexota bacterium]